MKKIRDNWWEIWCVDTETYSILLHPVLGDAAPAAATTTCCSRPSLVISTFNKRFRRHFYLTALSQPLSQLQLSLNQGGKRGLLLHVRLCYKTNSEEELCPYVSWAYKDVQPDKFEWTND
ncbi:uncharacterized protein LOC143926966 [Lithobates pipiens]